MHRVSHFILLALFLVMMPPVIKVHASAVDDYRDELREIAKTLRLARQQEDLINQALDQLKRERDTLTQFLIDQRYAATKNYHLQKMLEITPLPSLIFSPRDDYINAYYAHKVYKEITEYNAIQIERQIEALHNLEYKSAQIESYLHQKDVLELSVAASLEQLEDIAKTRREDGAVKEFQIIVSDLKEQSRSLNDFIRRLVPMSRYKSSGKEPTFILPVSGTIVSRNNGISINTYPNALITAPADGYVAFSDVFGWLGLVVIIDHGHGYVSVLRGFESLLVETGFDVVQGDPLGKMPNNPQESIKGENSPILYYELRYNGQSTNPLNKISGL